MNSNINRILLTVLTVLCVSGRIDCCAANADSAPYTISYKFTAGQVHHYSMTMDMNNGSTGIPNATPMNIHLEMSDSQTTQSVSPTDGSATTQVTMSANSALLNGQPFPADALSKMTPPQVIQVLSTSGQILSSTVVGGSAAAAGVIDPNSFGTVTFLPTKPVNVGDSWTSTVPLPKLNLTIQCVMTLKSVESVGNDSVALIDTKFTSAPDAPGSNQAAVPLKMSASLSGDALTNFDIDAGDTKSVVATMATDVSPVLPASAATTPAKPQFHMTMKMQMYLLP